MNESNWLQRKAFLTKVKNYFKVDKEEIYSANDKSENLLYFESLADQHGFNSVFYVANISKLNTDELFHSTKFLKSQVLIEFLEGEGKVNAEWQDRYVMVMYVNGALYVMFRVSEPVDFSGLVMWNSEDETGFAIQPLMTYLTKFFPEYN